MQLDAALPIRWAGGKRHLAPLIADLFRRGGYLRLRDPFVGGGSFVVGVGAAVSAASDSNAELINFYLACKESPEDLVSALEQVTDDRETYYRVRSESPSGALGRAVRFIYLNRTSYMGLHRTNRAGEFNVPYGGGSRLDVAVLAGQIRTFSTKLQSVELRSEDFRTAIDRSTDHEFLILDPPYGHSGDAPFRRYGREVFSSKDHDDLVAAALAAGTRGTTVLATLPADKRVLWRYRDWWVLAARKSGAGKISEVLLSPTWVKHSSVAARSGWGTVSGVGPKRNAPHGFWTGITQ